MITIIPAVIAPKAILTQDISRYDKPIPRKNSQLATMIAAGMMNPIR